MAQEIAQGVVRITLSDEEALTGLRKTEVAVERSMNKISRQEALVSVGINLKKLRGDVAQANAAINRMRAQQRALNDEAAKYGKDSTARKNIEGQVKGLEQQIQSQQRLRIAARNRLATEQAIATTLRDQDKIEDVAVRRAQLRGRLAKDHAKAEDDAKKALTSQAQQVTSLQREYLKLEKTQERMRDKGRVKRALSRPLQQEFQLNEAHVIAQMEVLRAKLEAMGAKPVDINIRAQDRESGVLQMFAGLSDVTARVGPFTASLGQLTRVAMTLGPVLVDLVGGITALAGALGTGLVGAAGIAGSAFAGLALSVGGVFLALKPIATQFKEINKASNAYHVAVHKFGSDSPAATKALGALNNTMKDLSPHARQAFTELGGLNSRWKELTHPSRVRGMETMANGVTLLADSMPMLARNTNKTTDVLMTGIDKWIAGLHSFEGQNIISTIMGNTTDALGPLMSGLGHLGAVLGRTVASFSRYFRPLAQEFDAWAAGLDHSSTAAGHLNTGVDHLVGAFRSTMGFVSAATRVVIAFFRGALQPGVGMVDDMTGSMNTLADSMETVGGQKDLNNFFSNAVANTERLYHVIQPLASVFFEFATIMRPFATIGLEVAGALSSIVDSLANFGPTRAIIQGMFALWLFRRGTAGTINFIAGAVEGLATALRAVGLAGKSAAVGNIATRLSGIGQGAAIGSRGFGARTAETVATDVAAVAPVRTVATAERDLTGASRAARVGAAAEGGLTAITGLSAPVLALTAGLVGSTIAVKKWSDSMDRREKKDQNIKDRTGVDVQPRRGPAYMGAGRGSFAASAYNGARSAELRTEGDAAVKSINDVSNASKQSGAIQRQLANTYSTVANSHLQVQEAEKAYAETVKASGKNSLDAKVAMQSLQDARRADAQAVVVWGKQNQVASEWAKRGIDNAAAAYKKAIGTPYANVMRDNLIKARDAAEALTLNVGRAKNGLDAFTGSGAEKLGRFARTLSGIPNVKRLLLQVDDQAAATKLMNAANHLKDLGHEHSMRVILRDSKTPEEALKRINTLADHVEKVRTAHIKAEATQARNTIDSLLGTLFPHYEKSNPTAIAHVAGAAAHGDIVGIIAGANAFTKSHPVNVQVKLSELLDDAFKDGGNLTKTPQIKGGDGHGISSTDKQGDGPGAKLGRAANAYAKSSGMAKKFALSHMSPIDQLGGKAAKGTGLNAFNSIATRFGLTIGSGTRPGAVTKSGNTSYHAMGRARDFPGTPAHMMAFAKYMAATFGSKLKELIYTPLGWGIKNGARIKSFGAAVDADHFDHVHVAMRQGGRVASANKPGLYSKPSVLFAEEPGHSEYYIPTNPKYRERSAALIGQAAEELGLVEDSIGFNATASRSKYPAGQGDGPGFAVNGAKANNEQARIIKAALREAAAQGAGPKATKALIVAIMAESNARNLAGGDRDSRGILQIRDSTAKGMHINNRSINESVDAFLNRGFYKHGGAKKLAKSNISAAQIAHLVQGNGTGVGPYASESGNADAAIRSLSRGLSLGGGSGKAPIKTSLGASNNLANNMAIAQNRLDAATRGTSQQNIVNAIQGVDRPMTDAELNRSGMTMQGGDTVHQAGMIELTQQQDRVSNRRLRKVRRSLRGKLSGDTRTRLLDEQTTLNQSLGANRGTRVDLRKQAAEAQFQISQGPANAVNLPYAEQLAQSTTGIDDDLQVVKAQQGYWTAREKWALGRGDIAGATEARTQINTYTKQAQQIQQDDGTNKIAAGEAYASLTTTMDDDLGVVNQAVSFWTGIYDQATKAGDWSLAATAGGNLKTYMDKGTDIQRQMAEMPLNAAQAAAALTTNLGDDVTASQGLYDYWMGEYNNATDPARKQEAAGQAATFKGQVKEATRARDLAPLTAAKAQAALTDRTDDDLNAAEAIQRYWQGVYDTANSVTGPERDYALIEESAGQLKSINDEVKGIQGNVQAQMISLGDARYDLFKTLGSNFVNIPSTPSAARAISNSTHVTVNNSFQAPPEDPHTWSQGVAWELQAAV